MSFLYFLIGPVEKTQIVFSKSMAMSQKQTSWRPKTVNEVIKSEEAQQSQEEVGMN